MQDFSCLIAKVHQTISTTKFLYAFITSVSLENFNTFRSATTSATFIDGLIRMRALHLELNALHDIRNVCAQSIRFCGRAARIGITYELTKLLVYITAKVSFAIDAKNVRWHENLPHPQLKGHRLEASNTRRVILSAQDFVVTNWGQKQSRKVLWVAVSCNTQATHPSILFDARAFLQLYFMTLLRVIIFYVPKFHFVTCKNTSQTILCLSTCFQRTKSLPGRPILYILPCFSFADGR